MVIKKSNVLFDKNENGVIFVKDLQGNDLEGFMKHRESTLTDFYRFNMDVTQEQLEVTRRIFLYLRAKRKIKKYLKELITAVKNTFPDTDVVAGYEKIKTNVFIIDVFLYR